MKEQLASAFGMCRRSAHPNNSPLKTNMRPCAHTLSSLILLSRLLEQHDWSACHLSHENQEPPLSFSSFAFLCLWVKMSDGGSLGESMSPFVFSHASLVSDDEEAPLTFCRGLAGISVQKQKNRLPGGHECGCVCICACYLVSHLAVSISPESVTEISSTSDGKSDKSFEGNELKCASFFSSHAFKEMASSHSWVTKSNLKHWPVQDREGQIFPVLPSICHPL